MLEQITTFLIEIINQIGFLGIFFATVIESFFPPIPSEIVLISAGFYASTNGGIITLLGLSIVASFGNYIGTLPFYLVSRFGAESFLPKFLKRWGKFLLITEKDLKKAHELFQKKGNLIVFLCRLIPGVRSLIAFPAGLAKMNFIKYTFFTLAGSFIWDMLISGVGYIAYEKRDLLFSLIKPVENLVLIGVIVAIFIYFGLVVYNFRKEKKA